MTLTRNTYVQRGELKLLSGNSNIKLAQSVAKNLGINLTEADINKFKDGEISIKINESIRGKDVFIMQPTSAPTNDNIMELLIMIDACRRASAGYINAVIPYYGYARQDRKTRGREPITAKLVANLLTVAGANRVITMDLHAGQIQGYFDIPVDHFSAIRLLSTHFKSFAYDKPEEFVVVSPDLGGVRRAREFADYLKLPIAIIEKRRPMPNVSEVMSVIGDFEGKHAIIVDDMIDTAGTITNAADFLVEHGAKDVYLVATHGVFSGDAIKKLQKPSVKEVIITDTIELPEEKKIDKIVQLSIAPLLAEAIHRINTYESISGLFSVLE
ncbi:ribose-phosphate pyrophosphokinase [Anaerococcus sp. NML200574]|uniref:Ribose-phosphate pyrophosphokinase n=1 Tax=Anaerococcus kampingae TaxID=3115614 RepID=A0ABW9MCM5_9FIRM|nr:MULTISPECIES: ribose-phosphate pyrophosphokinase [unclassified Anaerococcus]MCW6677898.1 ribose-phosphate pyrophosphokinase [Anaerococcus sp. NML200574]MCW6701222.1 ribose-phosphate pyrophosphokinase [Anaerococcus sp. NML200537]